MQKISWWFNFCEYREFSLTKFIFQYMVIMYCNENTRNIAKIKPYRFVENGYRMILSGNECKIDSLNFKFAAINRIWCRIFVH